LVARRAHNPKVTGSNPVPAILNGLVVRVSTKKCKALLHKIQSHNEDAIMVSSDSIRQLLEQVLDLHTVMQDIQMLLTASVMTGDLSAVEEALSLTEKSLGPISNAFDTDDES
jgi:hypothetical protein